MLVQRMTVMVMDKHNEGGGKHEELLDELFVGGHLVNYMVGLSLVGII